MFTLNAARRAATPFSTALLLTAALGAGSISSARAQTCEIPPSDTAPILESQAVRLVTFKIGSLSEVRMTGIPQEEEVFVGQVIPAGGDEQFLVPSGLNPVEVFALLAPADAPVPRQIAALDERGILANRRIVESIPETISVDPSHLGIRTKRNKPTLKVGGGSCQGGQAGDDYFVAHHCNQYGGPGYGSSESYCESGSWLILQMPSSSKRRTTYGRMASCGDGNNRLRHSYDTISGWETQVGETFAPGQVVDWWSSTTGIKRYRKVRYEQTNASGWVRGMVRFHSEVAGGW